ncbi:MAG: glycosyltransferase 87 family protein [Phototrophicaceae bacterium]
MVGRRNWIGYAVVGVTLLLGAVAFMLFFSRVNVTGNSLGMDWFNAYHAFDGGVLRYQGNVVQPPWSVWPLVPLGLLPEQASWGVLVYITLVTLFVAVPRIPARGRYLALVIATLASFPALRTMTDGNLEVVGLAGALLSVYAYRVKNPYLLGLGVLFLSSKPQSATLLLLVGAVYVLRSWSVRQWLITLAVIVVGVGSTFFWWSDWWNTMLAIPDVGSIMDSSLQAALTRTGVIPDAVITVARIALAVAALAIAWLTGTTLSREKAAMLMAAMLLIAPYAAGNSALTPYVIGVIPLAARRGRGGWPLIALTNLPFLALPFTDFQFHYSAYYWTAYFFIVFVVLAWHVWQRERVMPDNP